MLCEFAVEFCGGVGEVGLDVDELLEVVEGTVHLDYGDVVAVEGVGTVLELDAGEGAGELLSAGLPVDLGTLVEEVAGGEVLDALLLDHADAEGLGVVLGELGGEDLDGEVGELLLGGDESVEVGLRECKKRGARVGTTTGLENKCYP